MRTMTLWCLATLFFPLSLMGQTVLPDERLDSLRQSLLAWVESPASPAVSIAVAQGGQIIWQEALGWQDTARSQSVAHTSRFPIASVTKPFTATAILQLVEAGKLNLEDRVEDILGKGIWTSFVPNEPTPTVLDLLQHTGGMEMYYRNVYLDEPPYPAQYPISARTLLHPPGERFSYANVGYALLGEIIATVSGMPYATYLQSSIFAPLGLEDTRVRVQPNQPARYVQLRGIEGEPLPLVQTDTEAAGDIYSTAGDLLTFGLAHLYPEKTSLLPPKRLYQMRAMPTGIDNPIDPCQPYGLGWFLDGGQQDGKRRTFWHEGGLDGAGSMLQIIPSEELVIAVLVNTTFTKSRTSEIVAAIVETLAPEVAIATCPEAPSLTGVDTLSFVGAWKGYVLAGTDTLPLQLTIDEELDIRAMFNDQQTRVFFTDNQPFPKDALAHFPSGDGNRMICWLLEGLIGTPEWVNNHHIVQLELRKLEEALIGTAKAFQTNTNREGKAATFYLKLEKMESQ